MAVTLVTVTGNLETLIGTTPPLGRIRFKLNRPSWNLAGDIFAPEYVEAVADAGGAFSIALQSTADLEVDATYTAILHYRDVVDGKDKEYRFAQFVLPVGGPYQLGDLLVYPAPESGVLGDLAFMDTITASLISDSTASGRTLLTGTASVDGYEVASDDGTQRLFDIGIDGLSGASFGHETLHMGATRLIPPALQVPGAITRVSYVKPFWQFFVDGEPCIQRDAGDDLGLDPVLIDTPVFRCDMHGGQSWATQLRYPTEIDLDDPTGIANMSLAGYRSVDVALTRADLDFSPRIPYDNREAHTRAYSTDAASGASGPINGLRVLRFSGETDKHFFRTGDVASCQANEFRKDWRVDRYATVSLMCGMAGQAEDKFLAPGSTFAGSGGTVSAGIVASNARTFYENDTIAINELRAHVTTNWQGRRMVFDTYTFDQGGAGVAQANDDDNYFNFLNVVRSDFNARLLPTSDGGLTHILIPQGFAASKETFIGWQPIDQLRWAQANASGRDWLIGPFYHLPLLRETSTSQSAIHGTAWHNLRKAETMGLASAYVTSRRHGSWQPLWWTNIAIVGSTITLTVNAPTAAVGGLEFDTTTIEAAANYGFTLRNNSGGATITLGTPVITDATTITIPITGSLAGVTIVELGYAVRGVAQPDGAIGAATHSGCWGNVKAAGKHLGFWTGLPIDLWLCEFNEIITL